MTTFHGEIKHEDATGILIIHYHNHRKMIFGFTCLAITEKGIFQWQVNNPEDTDECLDFMLATILEGTVEQTVADMEPIALLSDIK